MKIFLGYPSEHEAAAWEVYNHLVSKGDDVWFDKVSLVAGTDWDQERDLGQRQADLAVHLCSAAILERAGVVNREIRQTLRLVDDQPLGSLYVIAIRLEPIQMPVELTRFQYFDLEEDWEQRLSDGVERRRSQLAPKDATVSNSFVREQQAPKKSKKIEFENISPTYECHGEYIQYEEKGLYWDFVNGAIASKALDSYFGNRSDFERLFDKDDSVTPDGEQLKHVWSFSSEEFFRNNSMLSLRFYVYFGYARAAHPNHYITTLNFFGESAGSIGIEGLLEHSTEKAQKILDYCEKVILAAFEGEISESSFFDNFRDEEQVWKLLSHFNFNQHGMTFNFSPYDVLPYVFGSHEVHVPWSFLADLVSEDYQDIIKALSN